MKMYYDGALIMPSSYAVMDDEEMTYVEGGGIGKHWFNHVGFVATVLDTAMIVIPGVSAARTAKAIQTVIKKNRKKMIKTIEDVLGKFIGSSAKQYAKTAVDAALCIAGTSVGGVIAKAIDYVDGNPNNYIFS